MYIRRVLTRRTETKQYYTFRLVHSVRIGGKVCQKLLLNLGTHFTIEKKHWKPLCRRIEEVFRGQVFFADELDPTLAQEAERIAQLLRDNSDAQARWAGLSPTQSSSSDPNWSTIDTNSERQMDTRTVGVESTALAVMKQVGLYKLLKSLIPNRRVFYGAIGNIIGRMACPGSEAATCR